MIYQQPYLASINVIQYSAMNFVIVLDDRIVKPDFTIILYRIVNWYKERFYRFSG